MFKDVQVRAMEKRPAYTMTRQAFDIIQAAAEEYLVDHLRKLSAVAAHAKRHTVAAHDLQFIRMLNGPHAWSAEPRRTWAQEILMDNSTCIACKNTGSRRP